MKTVFGKFSRSYLLFFSLIVLLTMISSGITACKKTELYVPLIIPLEYVDCIELSPQKLGYYYFDYNPIYSWLPTVDEVLTGRAIIMKNIEITDEILETRTSSSFKVTNDVMIKTRDIIKIKQLKAGDVVDILGFCKGISNEGINGESVVILEKCFIESPGSLNLPLDNEGSQNLMGY